MAPRIPLSVGDTYGDIISWRWDRSRMRFTADTGEHDLLIHFHKVGGRWSRTLPDGTASHGAGASYWTSEIDGDRSRIKHKTADDAKRAAVDELKRRFK